MTDDELEKEINKPENQRFIAKAGNWIKQSYREDWATMPNHLISCGTALIAAPFIAGRVVDYFGLKELPLAVSVTAADTAAYWITMASQLLYRDRSHLTNENGEYDISKIARKAGEYISLFGTVEILYALGITAGQMYLEKYGYSPANSAAVSQSAFMAFFTSALPPIRHGLQQLFGSDKIII